MCFPRILLGFCPLKLLRSCGWVCRACCPCCSTACLDYVLQGPREAPQHPLLVERMLWLPQPPLGTAVLFGERKRDFSAKTPSPLNAESMALHCKACFRVGSSSRARASALQDLGLISEATWLRAKPGPQFPPPFPAVCVSSGEPSQPGPNPPWRGKPDGVEILESCKSDAFVKPLSLHLQCIGKPLIP